MRILTSSYVRIRIVEVHVEQANWATEFKITSTIVKNRAIWSLEKVPRALESKLITILRSNPELGKMSIYRFDNLHSNKSLNIHNFVSIKLR